MTASDSIGRWVGTSLALHAGMFVLVLLWPALLSLQGHNNWGGNNSGNDGIRVKMAAGIPGIALPAPPVVRENAAANESKGLHTPEPAPKARPVEKVDDSPKVQLPSKTAPARPEPPQQVAANTPTSVPDNLVPYGQGGRPAIQYGQFATGAGTAGINFGDGSFGDRFGWYVESMTRAISQNWVQTVDPNIRSAPRVYISFKIARDGSLSDIKIDQGSGIYSLDRSAERAIRRSDPLLALPREYRGSYVDVRFWFEYSR
jgi:protein TonB